jgi:NAD(P)-dependent dehydrogenase (short-subunit alcohol dehydrogenase family)
MRGSDGGFVARSILITGGSSGIGEALALEFARRGDSVAVGARRVERLEALARKLTALGAPRVLALPLDVTDMDSIESALDRTVQAFGRIDVVVVNAGVGYSLPVGKGRFDEIRQTLETNLTGAIATIECALPRLRGQGGGQIVVVTSVASLRGLPFMGAYSAAKAGLHRYVQSLRAEVRYEPLTVTELVPGYIDTDMNRSVPNRPFVIPVERGAAIMARMIERGVGRRYVPMWPWMFVAPLLRVLPTRWLAPRRRQQR